MSVAGIEMRLARRVYSQEDNRLVLPDIDGRFFPLLKGLFELQPIGEGSLEKLDDYPELVRALGDSDKLPESVDPDFPPPETGVQRLFLMAYCVDPHELPGETRSSKTANGFQLLPLKTGWGGRFETVGKKYHGLSEETGWESLDYFLDDYLYGSDKTVGLANVVVWKGPEGKLSVGYLGMLDIAKPFSNELLGHLAEEFKNRVGISNGIFVSSSDNSGHFIALDGLLNRGELIRFNSRAGLINHVETGGVEEFYVDSRFFDHMEERYPTMYNCLRVIPLGAKPFIPRASVFLKDGELEFLPNEPLSPWGRELLGAGLI